MEQTEPRVYLVQLLYVINEKTNKKESEAMNCPRSSKSFVMESKTQEF